MYARKLAQREYVPVRIDWKTETTSAAKGGGEFWSHLRNVIPGMCDKMTHWQLVTLPSTEHNSSSFYFKTGSWVKHSGQREDIFITNAGTHLCPRLGPTLLFKHSCLPKLISYHLHRDLLVSKEALKNFSESSFAKQLALSRTSRRILVLLIFQRGGEENWGTPCCKNLARKIIAYKIFICTGIPGIKGLCFSRETNRNLLFSLSAFFFGWLPTRINASNVAF